MRSCEPEGEKARCKQSGSSNKKKRSTISPRRRDDTRAGDVKFLRYLRVTYFIGVEIEDMNAHSMFHLALSQIMEAGLPVIVLLEIFGDVFRNKDMPGVAAIHDALGQVNARTGNVGALIHIGDFIHRPAVNAHP